MGELSLDASARSENLLETWDISWAKIAPKIRYIIHTECELHKDVNREVVLRDGFRNHIQSYEVQYRWLSSLNLTNPNSLLRILVITNQLIHSIDNI
jgi:hypothetical protein